MFRISRQTSLQTKIATAMWVLTITSTLMTAILTASFLVHSHRQSIHSQLEATVTSLITLGISDLSELEDFDQLNDFIADTLQMERVDKIIRVFDSTGRIIFTTAGLDYDRLHDHISIPITKPVFITLHGKHRNYESLVAPFSSNRRRLFYLQVVIPLPHYAQILRILWWQDCFLLIFLVVLSFILSRSLAKRLLMPVTLIAEHVQEMDPHKMQEWRPLKLGSQGEYLQEIIRGINLLSERTRNAVLQIRKMGRYVAHELRTPLTILRGEAESILGSHHATTEDYRRTLESSLEEVERMSETIDTVLQLGEWERTANLHPAPCDLKGWLQIQKNHWVKMLGREIKLEVSPTPLVLVDQQVLFHLVDNLIRNIRDHTTSTTQCQITLTLESGHPIIKLSDNGPGLSPALLDYVNGQEEHIEEAGVGLNLCRRIAEVCKIKLRFSNLPEGGLMVEIFFNPL